MVNSTQLELAMRWSGEVDPAIAELVAGYRPVPGVHDELVDEAGRIRPHWLSLLARLGRHGPADVEARFAGADRYLSESGVVYRVYEDGQNFDRPWPLAHLPIVLDAADWAGLARGVEQRARLFEALIADLMGPADLVASGAVPAALVAGNPEFLRPLAGIRPKGGHFLHLYAADVSRAPDGRWWVLADRTQAPSGAGYAIENRIALSRALPEAFEDIGVERLGPFFQAVRVGLAQVAARGTDPRIALMSPGPWSETYFEHAFLARSLGFQLVEAGDLVASEAGVAVRTVAGLEPIDVLVRRIDADWADPLELNPNSRLGVPGLVEAVRAGRVVVTNALGTGLVEAPALTGYLPALSRRLLGEDLALPNVATWWCGEPAARDAVIAGLDDLVLAPAFGRTLPGILDSAGVLGKKLSRAERERYAAKLCRRGIDFVGREPLRLSTAPVWEKGRLVPRPFAVRVFVARTADGWSVMPGGLARFAERSDVRLLSMQRGGRSGDVWVLGTRGANRGETKPEARLMPEPDKVAIRRDNGILPSRAADNLFWFGRYLERAEQTARLLRGLEGHGDDGVVEISRDLQRRIAQLLDQGLAVPSTAGSARTLAEAAVWSPLPGAVGRLVAEAHRTASVVRDRLSPDAWRALAGLRDRLDRGLDAAGRPLQVFAEVDGALRTIAAIVGLAHETMNRREGWHFFDLGRRIERGIGLARAARGFCDEAADTDALDMLLDLADGRVTYRTRYLGGTARRPVLDLVLLDEANPRAVAYQVARVLDHLGSLADRREGDLLPPELKTARKLAAELETDDAGLFDAARIRRVEGALMAISDAVAARYFTQGSLLPATEEEA